MRHGARVGIRTPGTQTPNQPRQMAEHDEQPDSARLRQRGAEVAVAARRLDRHPRLLMAAKALRELLPGDSRFGDPLSTAGSEQAHLVARRLTALTAARPGVMREAGLSALQVWQAV